MKISFQENFDSFSISSIKSINLAFTNGSSRKIELHDAMLFPGLINAHDHLEFSLFPCLANKMYIDYKEWGKDIHQHNKIEIDRVLQIPLELRIKWGMLKNLISGVTAVVHHGHFSEIIRQSNYPVYLNYQYLHALATEPYWRLKLLLPLKKDVMIHVGEGTTKESEEEIDKLLNGNVWHRSLIGIHAINMNERQSKKFKSIIWCPDSNLRLYGKTAPVDLLKKHTAVLFGTDSAASASSNIWEHLRLARSLQLFSDNEIFASLTSQPSLILKGIENSGVIIAKRKSSDLWNSFFELDPEDLLLVSIKNEVKLIDQSMTDVSLLQENFILIKVGNSNKWIDLSFGSVVQELEKLGVSLPLHVSSIAH